jgi:serine/threonine-protein kinase
MVFFFTYAVARSSRKTTLDAIGKLQDAMRQVAQREALLQEARHDLDRALRIGGAGRYTDQVLGAYKLGVLIGRGAMGEVYEATHQETGGLAAVKLLHPNVLENPDHVVRFLREARAAAAIQSPHVVAVIDASEPLAPMPYLIMERLFGKDLAYHLRKRRRLSLAQLCEIVRQVGSVIDQTRLQGIVHRDLKPQNLFLADQPAGDPIWKILDFGVSKLGDGSGTLTRGHVVGTPVYMAPEQARGRPVDHRADLYALAAIAYRCVTGRPPFSGKDVPAVLFNVVYEMPPRPSELAPLPAEIDAVLAVGLAKQPSDRFATAAELGEALVFACEGRLVAETRFRAETLLSRHDWGTRDSASSPPDRA